MTISLIGKAAPALLLGLFCACAPQASSDTNAQTAPATVTPVPADKPPPVTTRPWLMATASVTDIDRTARFFIEIGGYEQVARGPLDEAEITAFGLPDGASGEALVLRAPGAEHGLVRLIRFDGAGRKIPTRPGARAWDTGCFWSLMVRAKDMTAIYDDAIAMGWWTETPITYLEFGPSKLNVVVFKGPDGLQLQAYERLTTPLPEGFTPFERISQPFNIMQMSADREAQRELMEDVLGFDRFWYGPPYTDAEPTVMPLGIPRNLTTSVPYMAGIFYPTPSEYGRMEVIEIDGLEGANYAEQCRPPNLGWYSVTYPVDDVAVAMATIQERGWTVETPAYDTERAGLGEARIGAIRSPDGVWIEFAETTP
jgi:catechol 2,3-dioxygenase-like lactoylglutathione lyase family enzyme